MINCPNCGAVIDTNADKCSCCGMPYYDLDLTCIDFDNADKPVTVCIKLNGEKIIMKACVSEAKMRIDDVLSPMLIRNRNELFIYPPRRWVRALSLTFIETV